MLKRYARKSANVKGFTCRMHEVTFHKPIKNESVHVDTETC